MTYQQSLERHQSEAKKETEISLQFLHKQIHKVSTSTVTYRNSRKVSECLGVRMSDSQYPKN